MEEILNKNKANTAPVALASVNQTKLLTWFEAESNRTGNSAETSALFAKSSQILKKKHYIFKVQIFF